MAQKFKRNLILHVNKYQKQILYPVFLACAFACILTIFCFVFILARVTNASTIGPIRMSDLQNFMPWMMILIAYVILFVVFWTYYISNKIVGPHERILRELDEDIEGKRPGPISTRQGDEMFEQLLKRINALIAKIPKP